jgi:hypothetical protein
MNAIAVIAAVAGIIVGALAMKVIDYRSDRHIADEAWDKGYTNGYHDGEESANNDPVNVAEQYDRHFASEKS